MELIKVTERDGVQFISSLKEIYLGAEMSKPHWAKWSKWNIEENKFFSENQDYQTFTQEVNGNETKDYVCTLEMAKHLVMQMPTDKAHEYRNYLIQLEKAWNNPVSVMARALQFANAQLLDYKAQIKAEKPLVDFAKQVASSSDSIDMGIFAKVIKDEKINLGRNGLFEWLRINKYLMSNNIPYQKYIDNGYFEVMEVVKSSAYGEKIFPKTLVTGLGQIKLVQKLKDEFPQK